MPKEAPTTSNTERNAVNRLTSKQPCTRKKQLVEVQDRSQWRTSEIATWSKAAALSNYHLRPVDLEGLPFKKDQAVVKINGVNKIRPKYLYKERDVELKAWEKHGGPEGFENFLKCQQEKWYAKHGTNSGKFFPQPSSYIKSDDPALQPSVPMITKYPTYLDDPQTSTPALLKMKEKMIIDGRLWLWDKLNKKYAGHYDPRESSYQREKIMTSALKTLRLELYEPRPTSPPPKSSSFDTLSEVLARAPKDDYGYDTKGLEVSTRWISGNRDAHWDQSYSDEVFTALTKIVEEHGIEGWKIARWLVYDKYEECKLGSLSFFKDDRQWISSYDDIVWKDSGDFWLDLNDRYPETGRSIASEPRK